MRHRTGTPAIAGLICAIVASPLFAQNAMSADSTTCADYMAMDSDGQMHAMEAMEMASSEGMMAESEGEMAAEGEMAEGVDDAMMAEGDGMMEEHMAAMSAACDGNPDMMAMDAMMSAMDH